MSGIAVAQQVVAPVVRRLDQANVDEAAGLLVRAFDHDPLNRVLFPDPRHRQRLLALMFRNRLQTALADGDVLVALDDGELAGVSVWFPPGVSGDGRPSSRRELGLLVRALPSLVRALPAAGRLLLDELPTIRAHRRQRRRAVEGARQNPAWHLAGLAVEPTRQGRGLARQLLDQHLARADHDGNAVWLETNYPANVPLYERFGFQVVGHSAGNDVLPAWWLMVRSPRLVSDFPKDPPT